MIVLLSNHVWYNNLRDASIGIDVDIYHLLHLVCWQGIEIVWHVMRFADVVD